MGLCGWKQFLPLALLAALPAVGFTQSAVPYLQLADTLPLDPDVRRGRLPNGFEYFILEHTNASRQVELRLVVNAGMFHEDNDQTGLAHLLEHMAFNGTKHFPRIRENFVGWGFAPGRNWNGGTGRVTDYLLRFTVENRAVYDSAFQVMRDWAQDLTLEPPEIDAERGVVLAEFRKDDALSRLQTEVFRSLLDHPRYPPDHSDKRDGSIRTFDHGSLERFFQDWYRPDLQALIVVGDVDTDDVERRIEMLFSDLKMPRNPRQAPDIEARYSVPLTGKNRFLVATHEAQPNTIVRIYHKRKSPAPTTRTVGDYRNDLMEKLYNEMIKSRFAPLTQQYNVPFRYAGHSTRLGLFRPSARIAGLQTELSFNNSQPVGPGIRRALIELERVRRYGFTAAELDQARNRLRQQMADPRAPSSSDLVRRLILHYSEGAAAPDLETERQLLLRLLDGIDVGTINALARDWLSRTTDRDVVIIAPAAMADRLPGEQEVNGLFQQVHGEAIAEYRATKPPLERLMTDREIAALRFDPNYESEYNDEIGTTELRLGNGIVVILKPFKASGPFSTRLSFRGSSPGGFLAYDDAAAPAAAQAASIVANAGVASFDKFELASFLSSRKISGGPDMFGDAATVSGSAPAKELETLLQLVHLYLTVPRSDSAAFEDWKSRQRTSIEDRDVHPVGWFQAVIDTIRFRETLPVRLSPYGEIVADLPRAEIERLRSDDTYRIYAARFLRAGDFTFALAGDFEPEVAVPLLVRYLGSLPAKSPIKPNGGKREHRIEARMGQANVTLYRGADQKAEVRLFFSGAYTPTLMAKAELDVLARALAIRIHERLRESEGGTYSTQTSVDPGKLVQGTYAFRVQFIAAPENVDRMIAAALEEIARLRDDGLDEKLFEAAVNGSLTRFADHQMNNSSFWTEHLVQARHENEDAADILKWRGLLKDMMTREAINHAARRYFGTGNMMRFVLLPAKYEQNAER